MSSDVQPIEVKRALRSWLISARARLTQQERSEKSRRIAERVEGVPAFLAARTIALYAPLGTEVDALEIARRASARGARVVFPRVVPGERRLEFARCEPSELVKGSLGTGEPPPGAKPVDSADVECVVMPGIGFSQDGHRLGRGGGYYDATLKHMGHAVRVGVAFDCQVVPELPREPHDAPLDALVTDARTLVFARERK